MKRLKEVIIIFTVAIIISLGSMITFSVLSEDSPIVNIKYNNDNTYFDFLQEGIHIKHENCFVHFRNRCYDRTLFHISTKISQRDTDLKAHSRRLLGSALFMYRRRSGSNTQPGRYIQRIGFR